MESRRVETQSKSLQLNCFMQFGTTKSASRLNWNTGYTKNMNNTHPIFETSHDDAVQFYRMDARTKDTNDWNLLDKTMTPKFKDNNGYKGTTYKAVT